jgi:hypothetical protein
MTAFFNQTIGQRTKDLGLKTTYMFNAITS